MVALTQTEQEMWNTVNIESEHAMSETEINEKYINGEQRIVTEMNREKLPNFYDSLKKDGYMEVKPFYQRRRRWDAKRQSRLIESFIMNIPVPPIFIYEKRYNQYEIMDGQQRVCAIKDFYDNNLELCGLEQWPELNGRKYMTLPSKIKAGIDRRAISSIVLLKESTSNEEDALKLRQTVFERLNTGGVTLERQEIRNALCKTKLNALLFDLAKDSNFRTAWGLPLYSEEEDVRNDLPIYENKFFKKMGEVELVLRFFALRNIDHYRKGMQHFLDSYMFKSERFTEEDIKILRDKFLRTLFIAHEIYGIHMFKPYDVKKEEWSTKAQKGYYDCIMVGLCNYIGYEYRLLEKKELILQKTIELFKNNPNGTFTGRGNTKDDIKNRIHLYSSMLFEIIGE